MIQGLDFSHFQGKIDWGKVAGSGRKFAIGKATQGATYTDPTFEGNAEGARDAGLLLGAYHFMDPKKRHEEQADRFLGSLKSINSGPLLVALDLEHAEGWDALSPQQAAEKADGWLDLVQEALHYKPLVYTYPSFARQYLSEFAAGFYQLWLARYAPDIPAGWSNWTLWQYSESGNVPGIVGKVDLDCFDGSIEALTVLGAKTP